MTASSEVDGSFAADPRWHQALAGFENVRLVETPSADGQPGLCVALRQESATPGDWLSPGRPYADLFDLAAQRPMDVEAVARALEQCVEELDADSITFARVRERSLLLAALGALRLRHFRERVGSSAVATVSGGIGESGLSKDNLRNVERLRRRAVQQFGEVRVESITDATQIVAAYERFLAVEDSSWKGATGAGTSLRQDALGQRFFKDVMLNFSRVGDARVDILRLGGRDAAAAISVCTQSCAFLLKIGFDPAFRSVGPGGILLRELLNVAHEGLGYRELSLTTDPSWAERWHFRAEPVYDVTVFGKSLRGAALWAKASAMSSARGLRDRAAEILRPSAE